MGFIDTFTDFLSSFPTPRELHAEAPAEDDSEDGSGGDKEEKAEEELDSEAQGEGDEADESEEKGDEEAEEEDEEEEEEDDEPVDLQPKIEAECAKSAACAPLKHHYQECAERVTKALEDPDHKGPHEDCVEEFFHLQHCATQCAAPKLFKLLK